MGEYLKMLVIRLLYIMKTDNTIIPTIFLVYDPLLLGRLCAKNILG